MEEIRQGILGFEEKQSRGIGQIVRLYILDCTGSCKLVNVDYTLLSIRWFYQYLYVYI
jgi:hypothetical protein